MSNILPFDFNSNQVRAVIIDCDPWFVLSDVCAILEIGNPSDAARRLDDDEVTLDIIEGSHRPTNIISESGLYSLVLTSRKPEAKQFKKWVTSEVLPSIRKNGGYIAGQENTDDPELIMARALQVAQNVIERKTKELAQAKARLAEQQPKVEFFDQVAGSKDAIDLGRAAKALNIQGMGRNNLFEFLRKEKILQSNNLPYQQYIDAGHFRVIEQKFNKPNGEININFKTLVYQRGLDFIHKRIKKSQEQII